MERKRMFTSPLVKVLFAIILIGTLIYDIYNYQFSLSAFKTIDISRIFAELPYTIKLLLVMLCLHGVDVITTGARLHYKDQEQKNKKEV